MFKNVEIDLQIDLQMVCYNFMDIIIIKCCFIFYANPIQQDVYLQKTTVRFINHELFVKRLKWF